MAGEDDFIEIGSDASASGGGGGDGASGGASASPAPVEDELRTRLDKLTSVLNSVVTDNQRREVETRTQQQRDIEQRISSAVDEAKAKVTMAETALAQAHEDGDTTAVARAYRALAEATAKAERIDADATAARHQLEQAKQKQEAPKPEVDTTNLTSWKARHKSWYGVDQEMTQTAHAIDREIREARPAGYAGSPEYFAEIDRRMAQRYPGRLGSGPTSVSAGSGGSRQQGTGGGMRIHSSVAEGMRRMGINIDDPTVARRYIENRKMLADKGILPQEPNYGRVRT